MKEIEWCKNTEDFAYRFTEDEDGLFIEIFHRHGELIKDKFIKF